MTQARAIEGRRAHTFADIPRALEANPSELLAPSEWTGGVAVVTLARLTPEAALPSVKDKEAR